LVSFEFFSDIILPVAL